MKMESNELEEEMKKFKHSHKRMVEFAEVDSVGIVHNIRYFYWMETARTDYLRKIGLRMDSSSFIKEFPVMAVHSEIDYMNPARFGDEYEVLTRCSFVKNKSVGFENIIKNSNGLLLARGKAVFAYLNPLSFQAERVSDSLRDILRNFEGQDIEFID